ncbi:hypothetical protein GCM10022198_18140 [Klugiella xanthotipulae]|uniref:Uncharacterized protein n=1 Tax=Klugiella xanthotipulae TaxID=244735 RepID=A0A543HRP5_9MICO|nr:hypothetical protein [Klugiella xanthotipulae]TQM61017.1 hypothetical protein FB466_1944 [Klugiella xanthotipulae]
MTSVQTISIDPETVSERLRELGDVAEQLSAVRHGIAVLTIGGPGAEITPRITSALRAARETVAAAAAGVQSQLADIASGIEETVRELGTLDEENARILDELAAQVEAGTAW